MNDAAFLPVAAGIAVFAIGVGLGRFAPTVALVVAILLVPLRVDVFETVYPATLLLCGAVLGRSSAMFRVALDEKPVLAATAAFPVWILASALWARQPMFVYPLLGKWLVVFVSLWFAAADRSESPRPLILATVASLVPNALWGFSERMHWVAPRGDEDLLRMRGIDWMGAVRGRALFWHPNRLGEFLEQAGILAAAGGLGGVLPGACLVGVVAAAAGVWGTGSKGSVAALGGGVALAAGWLIARRHGLGTSATRVRRGAAVLGVGIVAAVGVGAYAFTSHGGIGTRNIVFEHAANVIAQKPWVGFGGGNWSLLVAGAPMKVSRFWFLGHAHSLPLHVWAELGIVGVVLLFVFFAAPIVGAARRLSRSSGEWYAVGVGAAFAVAALFAHNFVHYFLRDAVDGIFTGLLLGTVIAAARRVREQSA